MIERSEYLEKLENWKNKDLIKVITGNGVSGSHIISINLESPDYRSRNHKDLYDYVNKK